MNKKHPVIYCSSSILVHFNISAVTTSKLDYQSLYNFLSYNINLSTRGPGNSMKEYSACGHKGCNMMPCQEQLYEYTSSPTRLKNTNSALVILKGLYAFICQSVWLFPFLFILIMPFSYMYSSTTLSYPSEVCVG